MKIVLQRKAHNNSLNTKGRNESASTQVYPGTSVADPDPGSCAFMTPGSGIRITFSLDPGSRTWDPKPIF